MLLTSTNIVHYLLERGLVSAEQVVDGDYMVVEAPRRNRNFKVMKRDRKRAVSKASTTLGSTVDCDSSTGSSLLSLDQ